MTRTTSLISVNARAHLPHVPVSTARTSGLPAQDCVVAFRSQPLKIERPAFSYFGTDLMDQEARDYYSRPTIYPEHFYLISLHRARIDGSSIIHKDGHLYPEGFRAAIFRNIAAQGTAPASGEPALERGGAPHHYQLTTSGQAPEHIPGRALLLKNTHANAWAFWQMDTAAKLYYWQHMGRPKDWTFLVDEKIPEYQLEVYCSAGVDPGQFVRLRSGQSYEVENLLVGSPLVVWNGGFSEEYQSFWDSICTGIAERANVDLKALQDARENKLLYISREDVFRHRPILNTSALEDYLRQRGADFVIPGQLSLPEKLMAFYGYQGILGALGSGTNNVVFSGGGGFFLGLWPWYLTDRYIVDMCLSLGRAPHLLFCDGFVTPGQSDKMKYKSPFVVDMPLFEHVLETIQAQTATKSEV